MKKTYLIIIFILFSTFSYSQALKGDWKGEISIDTLQLELILHIDGKNSKPIITFDIPDQSAYGLKTAKSIYDKKEKTLDINAGYGITFNLNHNNDSLTGIFLQAGYQGSVVLLKQIEKKEKKEKTAKVKMDFKEKDVYFYNEDSILGGTLAIPKGNNPIATVILITGSGTQTRDENIYGFKVFKTLSDSLANHNIMVLRYDDRGIGESTGIIEGSTTADYVKDAEAAFKFLQNNKKYHSNKIGVIGHSEGGLIATLLAQSVPLDFYIMMAGPATDGKTLMLQQTYDVSVSSGMEEEKSTEIMNLNEKLYESAINDTLWEESKLLLINYFKKTNSELSDDEINNAVDAQIAQLNTPWFRYFLAYDPSEALTVHNANIPILALFGSKDVQVSAELNIKHLQKLMQEHNIDITHITIKNIEDANHLFQKAITGSPNEYKDLDKEFIDGFTDVIIEYINDVSD